MPPYKSKFPLQAHAPVYEPSYAPNYHPNYDPHYDPNYNPAQHQVSDHCLSILSISSNLAVQPRYLEQGATEEVASSDEDDAR